MADCFWTDFVGCAEDCSALPTGDSLFTQVAGGYLNFPAVTFWFGHPADASACWWSGGTFNDLDNGQQVFLDTAYVKRVDAISAPNFGCGYTKGDAPDWFPLPASLCGVDVMPTPGTVYAPVDDLTLDLTPAQNHEDGSLYGSSMTCDVNDLWIAAGGVGAVDGILYLEVVGNNGVHYFGSLATTSCF